VGGGIRTFRKPDGTGGREYLDVGENPPNGAIVYYWLDEDVVGPVSLAVRDAAGAMVASFRSDDDSLPLPKRPSTRSGLNRFVWDLKYPGPERLDPSLAPPRNKPLAEPAEPPAGPTVVPGRYHVELAVGSQMMEAEVSVARDPRLVTTPEAYRRQFELLQQLTDSLGRLNAAVNRTRRLKHWLAALAERSADDGRGLAGKAKALAEQVSAVEAVLVDIHRESDRDVLRNPAGLNDTLVDLINTVAISDTAPTRQAEAVSREIMARVDAELGKLERLCTTELAAVERLTYAPSVAAAGEG
jgi:hypothetical protein